MFIQKEVQNQHDETETGIVGAIRNIAHKVHPAALGKALKRIHTEKGAFKKSYGDST